MSKTAACLIDALRRSAHLRPTLLIIDDIHLLDTNAANEFMDLTDALSKEPIGIICASRPGNTPAYTALFHQRLRYIELNPLGYDDIRQILHQCYGEQFTDNATLARVYETTPWYPADYSGCYG